MFSARFIPCQSLQVPHKVTRRLPFRFITRSTGILTLSCPASASRNNPRRYFSAAMATKQEWLVIVPDFEGAIDKRVAIRSEHLENVKPVVEAGKILAGGATLAEPLKAGEKPKMTGSVIIAQADTEAELREILQKDVYVDSGVWNWNAVQITPIKIAVRKAQESLGL